MSRRERRDADFSEFVRMHSAQLQRTAFLLCGDRHRAEDLVQIALTKLYVAWERVERRGATLGYTRSILVNTSIDESRRPWRREYPGEAVGTAAITDPRHDPDRNEALSPLLTQLRLLPPRQRAAVVLRYWEDHSVEETARLMGCTPSTVKTQSSRGLAALRDVLDHHPETGPHTTKRSTR